MCGGGALLRGGGGRRGQGHACGCRRGTHGGGDAFVLCGGGADFAVIGQVEQQVAAVVDDQVQRLNSGVGAAGCLVVGQSSGRGGGISRRNHEPAQGGSAAVVGVNKFNGVADLAQGTRIHVRDSAHLTQGTVADTQGTVAGGGRVHMRGGVVATAGGKDWHERQGGERRTAGEGQSVH